MICLGWSYTLDSIRAYGTYVTLPPKMAKRLAIFMVKYADVERKEKLSIPDISIRSSINYRYLEKMKLLI